MEPENTEITFYFPQELGPSDIEGILGKSSPIENFSRRVMGLYGLRLTGFSVSQRAEGIEEEIETLSLEKGEILRVVCNFDKNGNNGEQLALITGVADADVSESGLRRLTKMVFGDLIDFNFAEEPSLESNASKILRLSGVDLHNIKLEGWRVCGFKFELNPAQFLKDQELSADVIFPINEEKRTRINIIEFSGLSGYAIAKELSKLELEVYYFNLGIKEMHGWKRVKRKKFLRQ